MCNTMIEYREKKYTIKYEENPKAIPVQRWKASITIEGEAVPVIGYGCTKEDAYFDLTEVLKGHITD